MSFSDTLCNRCLGCNKLELPYFKGVYVCNNAVIVKEKQIQPIPPMKTKKVCDAIKTIHKKLGITSSPNVTDGEQIKLT